MIQLYTGLIIIVVISTPFIWWYLYLLKYKSLSQIPGPNPMPIIGNAGQLGSCPYELKENLVKLREKYGEIFKLYIGKQLVIMVSSPEWMEFILSSNVHISKSNSYNLIKPWLGEGLLLSTGDKWTNRRKMITPTFHFKILEQFNEVFNSAGNILVKNLSNKIDKSSFNIFPYINRCSLDIICETSMGIKISTQVNENNKYINAVRGFLNIYPIRALSSWKKSNFLFQFSPNYKEYINYINILHNFSNQVIEKRRSELKELKKNNIDNVNDEGIKRKVALLDMLLEYESNTLLTTEDIREEIDTFMFAGHDTVSSAISFTILALAKNAHIQQTLYEEILNIIGSNKEELITVVHLQKMKYLDRGIKESLRLYPPVPRILRNIEKEFNINGYKIPAGTSIGMFIYAMHRSKKLYPNPEKFDPDRFLIENQSSRHNYAYVPFSAGPRNCLGQKFALYEMKSLIINIIRNFKVILPPGFEEELGFAIILKSYNGIWVNLKSRDN